MIGSNIYRSQYQQQQEPLPHGYGFNPHQNEQYYQSQQPVNSVNSPIYQPQPPEEQTHAPPRPNKVAPMMTQSPQIVQEPSPKKLSYLIDWIVCFLPLVFLLIILILMVCLQTLKTRHINPEAAHATLEKLQYNLRAAPIIDIINLPPPVSVGHGRSFKEHLLNLEAVPTCPTGYGFASLGNWDGVHSGCLCDNGEVKSKAYCTLHFASDKCKSVKSVDKIPIGIWKEKKYCVKHSEDWKWIAGVECPTGKKNCGGNICIPQEHLCPLTALEESNTGELIIGGKKYNKIATDGLPLVDIEVVPGIEKADCFDSNLSPLFQSEKYYPLSRKPAKGCDKYKDLDDYTTDLDNEKVKIVLHQNDMDTTISGIPFYSSYITDNDHYTLQIIERIEIKNIKECGSVHPDEVFQITEKSQRVFNFETNISIILLILCGIVLILAPILYIMRKKVFAQLDMTEHHQPKFYMFVSILVVILCIILGFIYLTDVDGTDGLKDGNKKFGDYLKHECFVDEGLKLAVKEVDLFALNSYSTTYTWIITAFYVSIAFAVLMVILVIYQYSVHGEMFANPWKDRQIDQFRYQPYK